MAEVAKAIIDVSEVSSPEQFTFVLQLAVRPIIQLKIPPHLSAPTELKFEKERLTPEEITEENCCNLILPRPFHPKFAKLDFKDPTRCLAAAAHFLIRKKLFNTKYPQLHVAKDFAVAEKKLHLLSVEENTTQERRHLRENIPQMLKLQIPNHQLHKTNPLLNSSHKVSLLLNSSHRTSPSLNNSHKMSLSLNSSHKMSPSLNSNKARLQLNNHKTKLLIH